MIDTNNSAARSSWSVTTSVWRALFLREASARISAARFAWFWMLIEPIAHVVLLVSVRELLGRVKVIVNADFVPWLIVGITAFILFRYGVTRSLGAIEANQGLFAYRQVKPIDPVLIRAFLEGILQTLVFIALIVGASSLDFDIIPFNPLSAMFIWLCIWLLGFGVGLIVSVTSVLVEEVGRIVKITMFPLYFLSGVMIPMQMLPYDLQYYLLFNPLSHGIESLRLSFFEGYQTLSGINVSYMGYWIFASIAIGLALHIKFAHRLRAQ